MRDRNMHAAMLLYVPCTTVYLCAPRKPLFPHILAHLSLIHVVVEPYTLRDREGQTVRAFGGVSVACACGHLELRVNIH